MIDQCLALGARTPHPNPSQIAHGGGGGSMGPRTPTTPAPPPQGPPAKSYLPKVLPSGVRGRRRRPTLYGHQTHLKENFDHFAPSTMRKPNPNVHPNPHPSPNPNEAYYLVLTIAYFAMVQKSIKHIHF